MPASALITAAIEFSINQLLSFDPDSKPRLAALNGKQLTVFVDVLPWALTLAFSRKVDVLVETRSYESCVANLSPAQCCIQTRLEALNELTQPAKLTGLIQQGKLSVEGDLSIAQHVSALFQQLDIDWEEQLAAYTGDVFANQAFATINHFKSSVTQWLSRAQDTVGNAIVEEKNLAAHRLAVVHFSDEVDALRDDVERAEARIRRLEEQYKQS
ncbi:hypothetical protein CA267_012220 [Alteromonas pelagimontana]|uniref:Ubiquinone biosynthesis accessory factor UbiJ n=1 Tax=Alteromonas pelagimontana TaxID=1858656 RepID=A0A6M4MEG3_9ALTE|nr:SCP2 sterol-binding domain-containing protein [Alteromonas pelagimontana]QJR81492.1 hypothetical protein CA267_012220 [Alteromonas pelagimontana]